MRRAPILLIVVLALVVGLAGCGEGAEETPGVSGADDTGTAAPPSGSTLPEGYDSIPVTGPGESAALAALPAALEQAREMSWTVPDLTDAEPRLVAYLVRVDMDDNVALFEVRADGEAHNLYAYQTPFDSGTIVWTPTEMAETPFAEAQSDLEKAAVAAVETAMKADFDDPMMTNIHGYRFVYVKDDALVYGVEVSPEGDIISGTATP